MSQPPAVAPIDRLLAVSSGPVTRAAPSLVASQGTSPELLRQLLRLLERRNGFYAFESALQVYAAGGGVPELNAWNSTGAWRRSYGARTRDAVFFGQDAFGGQFGIVADMICLFDPETGEFSAIAKSFDEWAQRILDDYQYLTGQPLAHEWQALHGPLEQGHRLLARKPFVAGGAFDVANLQSEDISTALERLGTFAQQVSTLPDGTPIVMHRLFG